MGALKIFLIAGEPSGDALGGALLAGLRSLVPDIAIDGVGGPLMQAQGLESRFDMSELSVMGLTEVLPQVGHLIRRVNETAAAVIDASPDALVTIDSPDFSLRVAKRVKNATSIRTVHYVAPTVWAWRPGRAKKMARIIDHVLALFPFEPPYMEAAGIACDFVGHPVAVVPRATEAEIKSIKNRYDLVDASPLVVVLPGSRLSEVRRLGPVLGQSVEALNKEWASMRVVVPIAPGAADCTSALVSEWPDSPILLDPRKLSLGEWLNEKRILLSAADVALAASGSVALELAAAGTPMVSAYDMHWLSRALISRMMTTDSGNLINHVSETRAVPEVLGKNFTAANLVNATRRVLSDPSDQLAAMEMTMDRLGRGGEDPGLRAARALLNRL